MYANTVGEIKVKKRKILPHINIMIQKIHKI